MASRQKDPMHGTAAEDLEFYRRVKLDGSQDLVYADAGEDHQGITLNPNDGREKIDNGEKAPYLTRNASGSRKIEAAGAFSAGAYLYGAADGKIDDAVSGEVQGIALEAASADGDIIEMLPWSQVGNRFSSVDDSNGNEAVEIGATSSAVNHVKATNAATGNDPSLTAAGDDANVGIDLVSKGTGFVSLVADGTDAISVQKDTDVKVGFFDTAPAAQPSHIADASAASLTQSANEVTADGSVTVSDGSAPTNDEIFELAVENKADIDSLVTKLNSVLGQLATLGLQAAS